MFLVSVFKQLFTLFCALQFLFTYAYAGDYPFLISTSEAIRGLNGTVIDTSPWLKPGLLNSERIQLKFGSFGVHVLAQDHVIGFRLSNLYSIHDDKKVTRTIAFTEYSTNIDDKLRMAHEEIVAGSSIGLTLKKFGFDIKKDLVFKGLLRGMPDQLQSLMHIRQNAYATIIYNLLAVKDEDIYPYCTIVEVYSPDFLSIEEVNQIYPDPLLEKENTLHSRDIIAHMKQSITRI